MGAGWPFPRKTHWISLPPAARNETAPNPTGPWPSRGGGANPIPPRKRPTPVKTRSSGGVGGGFRWFVFPPSPRPFQWAFQPKQTGFWTPRKICFRRLKASDGLDLFPNVRNPAPPEKFPQGPKRPPSPGGWPIMESAPAPRPTNPTKIPVGSRTEGELFKRRPLWKLDVLNWESGPPDFRVEKPGPHVSPVPLAFLRPQVQQAPVPPRSRPLAMKGPEGEFGSLEDRSQRGPTQFRVFSFPPPSKLRYPGGAYSSSTDPPTKANLPVFGKPIRFSTFSPMFGFGRIKPIGPSLEFSLETKLEKQGKLPPLDRAQFPTQQRWVPIDR